MKQIKQPIRSRFIFRNGQCVGKKYVFTFILTLAAAGIIMSGCLYAEAGNGGFEVPEIDEEVGDYETVSRPDKTESLDRKECIIHEKKKCTFQISENKNADKSKPLYELGFMSEVEEHEEIIEKVAKDTEVDADLIRAIMYVETTHGWYDKPLSWIGRNKSILPMNINVDYWGDEFGTREELEKPENNIKAGAEMIKKIQESLPEDASVAQIATLYNNLNATTVNDYGARVEAVYDSKAWE